MILEAVLLVEVQYPGLRAKLHLRWWGAAPGCPCSHRLLAAPAQAVQVHRDQN